MLVEERDVAIWDVGTRSRWQPFIGADAVAVTLNYEPWDASGAFWCTRIELAFSSASVVLLLGEAGRDGEVGPSADNVAVLFEPATLPPWERREPPAEL